MKRPLAAIAVLAVIAVACGDSADPTTTTAPTETSAATSVPASTTTAVETPPETLPQTTTTVPSSTTTVAATTTTGGPTTTVAATTTTSVATSTTVADANTNAATPITALDSFVGRVEFTLATEEAEALSLVSEGTYVSGDVDCNSVIDFGGLSIETSVVVIGDTAWLAALGEDFVQTTADDPEVDGVLSSCPISAEFWSDFDTSDFQGVSGEDDVVNGVPAQRLNVGELIDTFGTFGLFDDIPEGITLETFAVWIADPGDWPVRIEVAFSATAEAFEAELEFPIEGEGDVVFSFTIEVDRANDTGLAVTPP